MPPVPSTYSRRKEHKIENSIELKHCGSCNSWKSLDNFNKNKNAWDKLRGNCKICDKDKKRGLASYYSTYAKEQWQKIKDDEEYKANKREYRDNNRDKLKAQFKQWYDDNKVEHNKKTYHQRKDDAKRISYMKEYRPRYEKNRREIDPQFKLKTNYSRRIREMLSLINSEGKKHSANKYLGCDIDYFSKHLEMQFTDDMSWDNQGKWHLDHIIPCASFDLTNEFEIFACFNYRNYQPLMGCDNIAKSDKYDQKDRDQYLAMMKPIFELLNKK